MAGPPCMSSDGNPAVFVGTFLQNGDAVALCGDCLPSFLLSAAALAIGLDPAELEQFANERTAEPPDDPAAEASEAAAPPTSAEPPLSGGEPPAPAPHDTDPEAVGGNGRGSRKGGRTSPGTSDQRTDTAAVSGE